MNILCLLNPSSADGKALAKWPQVAALMSEFGMRVDLLAEKGVPLQTQLIRHVENTGIESYAAIAGIGGDGTHSCIFNAMLNHSRLHPGFRWPPYAFIPMGTGNDIARSLGLASRNDFFVSDLRRSVSTIIHGADYRMDLGLLNGKVHFADALAIGLDSRVLQERNINRRWIRRVPVLRSLVRGKLLYTLSFGPRLLSHTPFRATIDIDGARWHSGPIVNLVIKNTRIYAGEFDFCPATYSNDGLLDVVVFTGPVDYLTSYILALRSNPQAIRTLVMKMKKESTHIRARRIVIGIDPPEAAQLDGEEIPAAERYAVEVIPGAVHIKTPAEP